MKFTAFAPGRVNLIGEHVDYTGGLALPMAIEKGITIKGHTVDDLLTLSSTHHGSSASVALPVDDPANVQPEWMRLPAGVAAELDSPRGIDAEITSDLPIAGLSSSAALAVATGLALGFDRSPLELALLCQRAEHNATGVPCGVMDQLASAAGVEGAALLMDCETNQVSPVPMPSDVEVRVIHSGQHRELVNSAYGQRRAQCEAASELVGPLRHARLEDLDAIDDPVVRARARHVISENARVLAFVDALTAGDYVSAGALMVESHRSLAVDFEVSTEILDALVDDLIGTSGVFGARLTGAGFGGAVIALCVPGALERGFAAHPSAGARIETD